MPQRLPQVDGDDGLWGDILNQYLEKEHYNSGSDNAANGGHKTITIRPGASSPGGAPLKFTSGTLLSTPEAGAIEFNTNRLYFTQTLGSTRKTVAAYDDASGAAGDIYYRNSGGDLIRLPAGSSGNLLAMGGSSAPVWTNYVIAQQVTAVFGDYNNTASVSAGSISYVRVPYAGTITSWSIIASGSSTCVIDVWKLNADQPTVANTITASAKPALTAQVTATSTTLTGWSPTVSDGDVFAFKLDSVSGSPKGITLTLKVAQSQ